MKKVLVVCNDEEFAQTLHRTAGNLGFQAESFPNPEALSKVLSREVPSIILLDLDSSPIVEAEIVHMAGLSPHSTLIALSRRSFHPELARAFAQHIRVCLRKPVDLDELSFWLRTFAR